MLQFLKKIIKSKQPVPPKALRPTSAPIEDDETMVVVKVPMAANAVNPSGRMHDADANRFPVADCGGVVNQIGYCDARGQASERLVTFYSIKEKNGTWYLQAHCHERNAFRSFRCDRIEYCIDPETGEIQDDFFNYIASIFSVEKDAWINGAEDAALAACKNGGRILMFLARCDGEYHPLEREVIAEYVNHRCGAKGIPADISAVMRFLDNSTPNAEVYYDSVDKMIEEKDAKHIDLLMRCAVRIVEADGKITQEEATWLTDINAELH